MRRSDLGVTLNDEKQHLEAKYTADVEHKVQEGGKKDIKKKKYILEISFERKIFRLTFSLYA